MFSPSLETSAPPRAMGHQSPPSVWLGWPVHIFPHLPSKHNIYQYIHFYRSSRAVSLRSATPIISVYLIRLHNVDQEPVQPQNVTCAVVAQSVMGTVSVAGYMASAAVL